MAEPVSPMSNDKVGVPPVSIASQSSVTPVTVAFEMELPDDAPPTAAAVHSSINWYVHARLTYRDVDGQLPERVRRPITVVNAP